MFSFPRKSMEKVERKWIFGRKGSAFFSLWNHLIKWQTVKSKTHKHTPQKPLSKKASYEYNIYLTRSVVLFVIVVHVCCVQAKHTLKREEKSPSLHMSNKQHSTKLLLSLQWTIPPKLFSNISANFLRRFMSFIAFCFSTITLTTFSFRWQYKEKFCAFKKVFGFETLKMLFPALSTPLRIKVVCHDKIRRENLST